MSTKAIIKSILSCINWGRLIEEGEEEKAEEEENVELVEGAEEGAAVLPFEEDVEVVGEGEQEGAVALPLEDREEEEEKKKKKRQQAKDILNTMAELKARIQYGLNLK